MSDYNHKLVQQKWLKSWKESTLFSPNFSDENKPFYNLMMFPYPSAEGLHVGNMYAFCGSDIYGRMKRMQGYGVFEPIGLDGFGIHSENYAIKVGKHPKEQAKVSQKNFYRQLEAVGNAYDWKRTLETYDPWYYKWTQWIFIQLFKKGLAYRAKSPVNFCPSCKTVLADEQVIDGKCERCASVAEKKDLEQWFFGITKYADRLLSGLDKIDWSERVKTAQRNWIGRKEGIEISYQVANSKHKIAVFTTRPDTNFGATFVVLAPEHPQVFELTTSEYKKEMEKYIKVSRSKTNEDRIAEGREKTGVFTGSFALNNLTGEKMPVWVSDFALMDFGTGAVVGVPGHDNRDFEFASKFKIPIKRVVVGKDGDKSPISRIEQVQEEEGKMINSQFLDGMDISRAKGKIMDFIVEKGWGERKVTYHLRDWLISRQRYWGPPIPMIYCKDCGWQSEKEENLPVLLPDVTSWKPTGSGKSPLATVESFVNVKCPKCGGGARRETDVSDTFLDSAWYFLRYTSTDDSKSAWNSGTVKKWLPVDMYIGGAEHSVLHLLYTRFLTMVFCDLGLLNFEEPFTKFRAHGLLVSQGAKMSKSRGNIVNPDDYIEKYGTDTLRCYLMFCGRFMQGGDFQDRGIEGISRFLKRVWRMFAELGPVSSFPTTDASANLSAGDLQIMHQTIKKVTEDIESLDYNTAISALMIWLRSLEKRIFAGSANSHSSLKKNGGSKEISKLEVEAFLKLLAPFAPFITEELWSQMNPKSKSIHFESWPEYDLKLTKSEQIEIVVQVNGKFRESLSVSRGILQTDLEKLALASERVQKHIEGRKYEMIYVADKLINFVLK